MGIHEAIVLIFIAYCCAVGRAGKIVCKIQNTESGECIVGNGNGNGNCWLQLACKHKVSLFPCYFYQPDLPGPPLLASFIHPLPSFR